MDGGCEASLVYTRRLCLKKPWEVQLSGTACSKALGSNPSTKTKTYSFQEWVGGEGRGALGNKEELGVVVPAYKPGTEEVEAGGL